MAGARALLAQPAPGRQHLARPHAHRRPAAPAPGRAARARAAAAGRSGPGAPDVCARAGCSQDEHKQHHMSRTVHLLQRCARVLTGPPTSGTLVLFVGVHAWHTGLLAASQARRARASARGGSPQLSPAPALSAAGAAGGVRARGVRAGGGDLRRQRAAGVPAAAAAAGAARHRHHAGQAQAPRGGRRCAVPP